METHRVSGVITSKKKIQLYSVKKLFCLEPDPTIFNQGQATHMMNSGGVVINIFIPKGLLKYTKENYMSSGVWPHVDTRGYRHLTTCREPNTLRPNSIFVSEGCFFLFVLFCFFVFKSPFIYLTER